MQAEVPALHKGNSAPSNPTGPFESEICGPAPRPYGLGLVSRSRPAVEGTFPVIRRDRRPLEVRMAPAGQQCPVDVVVDVGGEAECATGLQDSCEPVQVGHVHESPFPVFFLRPRIRIQQIDPVQRCLRQPVEQPGRVIVMETRRLPGGGSSSALSSLAMPLTNGSTPMNPVCGERRTSESRCSPPPNPISR